MRARMRKTGTHLRVEAGGVKHIERDAGVERAVRERQLQPVPARRHQLAQRELRLA